MSFGETVKNLRIAKKVTLRQFCQEHGCDPSNWSKIERGINPPPKDEETLMAWAKALNSSQKISLRKSCLSQKRQQGIAFPSHFWPFFELPDISHTYGCSSGTNRGDFGRLRLCKRLIIASLLDTIMPSNCFICKDDLRKLCGMTADKLPLHERRRRQSRHAQYCRKSGGKTTLKLPLKKSKN